MRFEKLRQAFNRSEYLPAKDLAQATGLKPEPGPGNETCQGTEREVPHCPAPGPREREKGPGLAKADFEIDQNGCVTGTQKYRDQVQAKVERNLERLKAKAVLCELNRVADSIEQEEPNAKRSDLPG
jgi:hypothetical protein